MRKRIGNMSLLTALFAWIGALLLIFEAPAVLRGDNGDVGYPYAVLLGATGLIFLCLAAAKFFFIDRRRRKPPW